jgi:hypothetical protein
MTTRRSVSLPAVWLLASLVASCSAPPAPTATPAPAARCPFEMFHVNDND